MHILLVDWGHLAVPTLGRSTRERHEPPPLRRRDATAEEREERIDAVLRIAAQGVVVEQEEAGSQQALAKLYRPQVRACPVAKRCARQELCRSRRLHPKQRP